MNRTAYFRLKEKTGQKDFDLKKFLAKQYLCKELGLEYLGEKTPEDILEEIADDDL